MHTVDPVVLLTARTFQELHDRLPGLDVNVPPYPAERGDTPEIYSIVRLLGTIPLRLEDFPLVLSKTESPDFALQLGGRSIGVEHIEAVPENAVHEAKLRAAQGSRGMYFVRPATAGEPRKSRKELQKEIDEDWMPPAMAGDSVERNWADAMVHSITKKCAIARKPGYKAHDQQWLLIYDNWPSLALERQHALELLQERLPVVDPFAIFARIFILTGATLMELSCDGLQLHQLRQYPSAPLREASRIRLAVSPGGRCSALRSRHRRGRSRDLVMQVADA